jgi:hypothetical protein
VVRNPSRARSASGHLHIMPLIPSWRNHEVGVGVASQLGFSEMPPARLQKHLALRLQHKRAWRQVNAVLPSNALLRAIILFGTGEACPLAVGTRNATCMYVLSSTTKDCRVAGAAVLCCTLVCGFVLHMHVRWYVVNALAGA